MNKTELVRETSKKIGMTQKDTGIVLDAIIETIKEGLVEDSRVALTNFGSFNVTTRDEYEGHNPATGEPMTIPKTNVLRFRVSDNLKKKINE